MALVTPDGSEPWRSVAPPCRVDGAFRPPMGAISSAWIGFFTRGGAICSSGGATIRGKCPSLALSMRSLSLRRRHPSTRRRLLGATRRHLSLQRAPCHAEEAPFERHGRRLSHEARRALPDELHFECVEAPSTANVAPPGPVVAPLRGVATSDDASEMASRAVASGIAASVSQPKAPPEAFRDPPRPSSDRSGAISRWSARWRKALRPFLPRAGVTARLRGEPAAHEGPTRALRP
jgi:hypothetical protein